MWFRSWFWSLKLRSIYISGVIPIIMWSFLHVTVDPYSDHMVVLNEVKFQMIQFHMTVGPSLILTISMVDEMKLSNKDTLICRHTNLWSRKTRQITHSRVIKPWNFKWNEFLKLNILRIVMEHVVLITLMCTILSVSSVCTMELSTYRHS